MYVARLTAMVLLAPAVVAPAQIGGDDVLRYDQPHQGSRV
jgi:hypothetical protein